MVSDDLDRQEIDRLVRELSEPPKPAASPAQTASAPASEPPPAAPQVRQVSRWTTARILMPAMNTPGSRWSLASLASSIKLPNLPNLPNLPALPELPALPDLPRLTLPALSESTWRVLIVRAWVTLGVLLSVSMAYWPYPKTYLAGLLLYLFAVALVVVAGIWSAKLTWDVRLGGAHTVALGIVIWAIALVAAETLRTVSGGV